MFQEEVMLHQDSDQNNPPPPSLYPLAHAQWGIWLGCQSRPEGSEYNMAYPLRIRSPLHVPHLVQALQCLVNRHALLRTTFPLQNGEPRQLVHGQQRVAFVEVAGAHWSPAELQQWAQQATRAPYDLAQGPLFRAYLVTCTPDDHLLLLLGHHIVLDMMSWWTLLEELGILYPALQIGAPPSLPAIEKEYAAFVTWHNTTLANSEERLWRYWEKQLAGTLPVLALPTAPGGHPPRPSVKSFNGATATFCLPDALTDQLRAVADKQGATLYMTLLAAYQVLLTRLAGQTEIVVGTPVAARVDRSLRHTVGLFADLVPLRADLAGNPSFKDFLHQVSQTVLRALVHQHYPFYKLVEKLNLKQGPSHTPIFQTTFQLERASHAGYAELLSGAVARQFDWGGLLVETFPIRQQEGRADLAMIMYDNGQQLFGTLLYDTDLFDAATIQQWIGHFQTLLTAICADPAAGIADLPLLTAHERYQLLVEWNNMAPSTSAGVGYPAHTVSALVEGQCIHQLFAAQAARTPAAVALIFGDQQLTYAELNARANQLAHHLRAIGVSPTPDGAQLVGICCERSFEMIIGVLGIWKAGGAYVPLDPNYPPARLAFMLEETAMAHILTQQHLCAKLDALTASAPKPTLLCLDQDWATIAQQPDDNVGSCATSADLAYIIYTSGSTGQPKGVMVEHGSLTNVTYAAIDRFHFQHDSRVIQFASLSFDASLLEITTALCSGGRLYLPTPAQMVPGPALSTFLQQAEITYFQLPPAVLRLLPQVDYPALRVLMTIGDACTAQQIAFWSQGRYFCNGYGPTECTIGATSAAVMDSDQTPPIGRPFNNVHAYVLDHNGYPVPIGIPGELYLGGIQVARGYFKRPALTAEKFVALADLPWMHATNDISPAAQNALTRPAKLYRTGDRVRYLANGDLDFIGRLDQMVKLRGIRIELGEIEAVLTQHPAVQEAVVITREDVPGEKRLVAYVVTHDRMTGWQDDNDVILSSCHPVTLSDLRSHLQQKLPDYMVPTAFVLLEAFPLTPNGKVDRKALPAPDLAISLTATFAPPTTPTEIALAEIWSAVLEILPIGIDDDFFALGGHSLLATQVILRVREHFAIDLPLRAIFQATTLAALAEVIELHQLSGIDEHALLQALNAVEQGATDARVGL